MPPYTSFSFAGTVSLPVDTAATQGDGKHHASYDGIFPFDVSRTNIAGIWVAFFSRCQRYSCGQDTHGIRSAAAALSESGAWRLRHKSEPSAYMPLNPIPEENAKRIRYLVFEVLE